MPNLWVFLAKQIGLFEVIHRLGKYRTLKKMNGLLKPLSGFILTNVSLTGVNQNIHTR